MKTAFYLFLTSSFLILIASHSLHSQETGIDVPRIISYQGFINNSDRLPISNGTYRINVNLYSDSEGLHSIWSGSYETMITNGLFHLFLGSGDYPFTDETVFDRPLWLGVALNGQGEMFPFTPLSSVPYAMSVSNGSISTSELVDGAVTAKKLSVDYISSLIVDGISTKGANQEINIVGGKGVAVQYDASNSNIIIELDNALSKGKKGARTLGIWGNTNFYGFDGDVGSGPTNNIPNATASQYNVVVGGDNNDIGNGTDNPDYTVIGGGKDNNILSDYGTISGGENNLISTSSHHSTLAGGEDNEISDEHATISGGSSNTASNEFTVISGGSSNTASGVYAITSGGFNNIASNTHSVVSGGQTNKASGLWSTVSGGYLNWSENSYTSISGGSANHASGLKSTIGGGEENDAQSDFSSIAGGYDNNISAANSTIGGGYTNDIEGSNSTIGGGNSNKIYNSSSTYNTIGGGSSNNVGASLTSSSYAFIGGGSGNKTLADYSVAGGGNTNTVSGSYAVIAGGSTNTASGSYSVAGGGSTNTVSGNYAVIAGGNQNNITSIYATIGGGTENSVSGTKSTIGGGELNMIGAGTFMNTIGGGQSNSITSTNNATIGGGVNNIIQNTSNSSTIGGGFENTITSGGILATIPGGTLLRAKSFAQTVMGVANVPRGSITPGFSVNFTDAFNDPLLIVGNGNGIRMSNAFEVSYNGHSIVYDKNGSGMGGGRAAVRGATYMDNTIYAWGDINDDGSAVCDFGVQSVQHLGIGWYRITLNLAYHDGTPMTLDCASITVTQRTDHLPPALPVDPPPMGLCSNVTTSRFDPATNTFDVYITAIGLVGAGGNFSMVCNSIDRDFMFKVTGRPSPHASDPQ